MIVEHNSRNEYFRHPFGAVTTGVDIVIRVIIKDGGIPEFVRLVISNKRGEISYYNMAYVTQIGGFSAYEVTIPKQTELGNLWYYFDIKAENEHIFYGNNESGLGGMGKVYNKIPERTYQITIYSPEFKTPKWWKNSICYQIFCDRFSNGNEDGSFLGERQDIIKRNWKDTPFYKKEQFGGEYLANDFFGGNLKGILKKLEYLKDLGVGAIYLNPIFKAYSNHKYDTGDYHKIDEMFGSEKDFIVLCETAYKMGIRIILDGVFNHTGSDSKYFNINGTYDSLGAYQSKDSEYYEWYNFKSYNNDYESWWGIKTLPHVNESSESYQEYILTGDDSVVKRWLEKGASGWRLDVVDELPGFFVKKLREEVKKTNPDAVIIGEVWEDASNKESYGEKREYFLGEELDSVMNYPLRDALVPLVLGKISGEEFDNRLMSLKENYPKEAFYSLMNMLSSHDMERILTKMSDAPDRREVSKQWQADYVVSGEKWDRAVRKTKEIVMLQMLLPGVPCVYYGDEAGLMGYGDPFCRNTYPWGEENMDILNWYKKAIAMRKSSKAFVEGDIETVFKAGKSYGFIRELDNEKKIVVANFDDHPIWLRLDLARFKITKLKGEMYEEEYSSDDGIFYIQVCPDDIKVLDGK